MIANFVLFQLLWFTCVWGAAKGMIWPGAAVLTFFLLWQLQRSQRAQSDIALIVVASVVGIIVDTIWVKMGLLRYEASYPFSSVAPIWIIFLWSGFALTINHSLAWLKGKIAFAIVLSMLAAPLSYFAGYRLGALEFTYNLPLALLLLSVAWGIVFPLLVVLSNRLDKISAETVVSRETDPY